LITKNTKSNVILLDFFKMFGLENLFVKKQDSKKMHLLL
jgi:hypothetical protein